MSNASGQGSLGPRRRVLWLIKGLGPGGAENLLVSLASVADHERFEYDVAYVRPDKRHLVPDLEKRGVRSVFLGASPRQWGPELNRLIRSGDYAVIHAHSPLLASAARVMVKALPVSRRPRMYTTEHNRWPSFAVPTRLANAVTSRLDDVTWAVSEGVRQSMRPGQSDRTSVLVHGISTEPGEQTPTSASRAATRTSLGVHDKHVLVATVANYRPEKDYPTLLQAAASAATREPSLRFIFVGQGPRQAEIEAMHRRLGLEGVAMLLGYRSDVPDLLAAADIFLLASRHEGLPVSLMEAMACGLPTVATSVGGVPEAVRHGATGFLVPCGRPDLLADRLVALARDPSARGAMAEQARASAGAFDIRRTVTHLEAAYAAEPSASP